MNNDFFKKYASHFICKVCVWEGVGDRTELQHLKLLSPSGHSCVSFSFSWTAQPGAWGPASLGHVRIPASSRQLVSKLTDFLSSPSYIIVQSPTQSLEWHIWSSSSGNNCHAVHRSLSSGASVYDCITGFYLVSFCQPSPPTRFLPITAIGMCHFLLVHHFGMVCLAGSKVNIQHKIVVVWDRI